LTDQNIVAGSASKQLRLHITRVDLPAFGDIVFYAEWQDFTDPTDIHRQRFYVLREEPQREELRLELHIFDPAKVERNAEALGAHLNPSQLADFTPADMFPLPGCDIFFQVEGRQFRGEMDRGACELPETEPPLYSYTRMLLGPESFWYKDGWYNAATDQPAQLMTSGRWVEFEKPSGN